MPKKGISTKFEILTVFFGHFVSILLYIHMFLEYKLNLDNLTSKKV